MDKSAFKHLLLNNNIFEEKIEYTLDVALKRRFLT
ncbi:hypothetical protein BN1013_00825 [Candidatus Rubidus massiliensis]|nr:hypothetical protein BN1013_00825 [Candidatus Rubidus massiliensis]